MSAVKLRSGTSSPARTGAVLAVHDLAYERDGRRVLDGVTFALRAAELVAVMGPSGSGKTTLLKCLNRLSEPTRGTVLLEGADTRSMPAVDVRRRIGMVWQVPFMFAGTVRDNLRRAAGYSGTGLAEEQIDDLLERVSFDGDPDADARALSVGQQQRVGIARALACRPTVLLCDEPTSALDHDSALRLEATFRALCASALSVVWVTHDSAQAQRLADRTLMLAGGAIKT